MTKMPTTTPRCGLHLLLWHVLLACTLYHLWENTHLKEIVAHIAPQSMCNRDFHHILLVSFLRIIYRAMRMSQLCKTILSDALLILDKTFVHIVFNPSFLYLWNHHSNSISIVSYGNMIEFSIHLFVCTLIGHANHFKAMYPCFPLMLWAFWGCSHWPWLHHCPWPTIWSPSKHVKSNLGTRNYVTTLIPNIEVCTCMSMLPMYGWLRVISYAFS